MKWFTWISLTLLAIWVSAICLFTLLSATEVKWLPDRAYAIREQLSQPSSFAVWVVAPTLTCCILQIWQVRKYA